MTAEEYKDHEQIAFDLADIPDELRSGISYLAYEQGHAYGYSEVYIKLSDIIEALDKPLKLYTERIKKESV